MSDKRIPKRLPKWLQHPLAQAYVTATFGNDWKLEDVERSIRIYERLRDFEPYIDQISVEVQHYLADHPYDPRWAPRLRQLLAEGVDITLDKFLPLPDQDSSPTQGG